MESCHIEMPRNTVESVLYGVFQKEHHWHIISHVINVYKQIVFQFRKNNKCLSLYEFIRKLIDIERMEHIIAIKNNKVYKHLYEWEAVKSKLSKSLCTT